MERPKLHTEALREWVEYRRDKLKLHFEQQGKGINTLTDT